MLPKLSPLISMSYVPASDAGYEHFIVSPGNAAVGVHMKILVSLPFTKNLKYDNSIAVIVFGPELVILATIILPLQVNLFKYTQ